MTEHLTPAELSAFADGELGATEMTAATAHIDGCLDCAKAAVDVWVLKSAVARSGRRDEPSVEFRKRMAGQVARGASGAGAQVSRTSHGASRSTQSWTAMAGWAVAAVLLLAVGGLALMQFDIRSAASRQSALLVAEACDLHIATLAANQPPQVVSSDRHTVKPWFQGKLPFSFNLPETLPADTTLDGANLAYLANHPVAQLLFSIGRHHVSVIVAQRNGNAALNQPKASNAGFQVATFTTDDLEMIAVSDVDPARLAALTNALEAAQANR